MKPNIAIIVLTVLAFGGAYWYFFTGTGNDVALTQTAVSDSSGQAQFRSLVSQLQSISFNTAIFSDPNFDALVDIATPVTPEVSGRIDPFALIPGVAGK